VYTNHYKLEKKPFQIISDPQFLWLGDSHKEALAVLQYGILDNKGFLLLTGDVGTGKTTLINALIDSLGDEILAATVPDPGLEPLDFYNYVAFEFGKEELVKSKGEFIFWFRRFLNNAHQSSQRVLLIIDEAQRLDRQMLEEIRLLSNIELDGIKLLNIFFVGQNEFNELLWDQANRALRQRITINFSINPLSDEETGEYILHRLNIAGSEKPIFTPDAIADIASFSGGFPRTINIICDHALLTGYVAGKKKIDNSIIKECVEDLRIPNPTQESSATSGSEMNVAQITPESAQVTPESVEAESGAAASPEPDARSFLGGRLMLALLVIGILAVAAAGGAFFFDPYLKELVNGQSHPGRASTTDGQAAAVSGLKETIPTPAPAKSTPIEPQLPPEKTVEQTAATDTVKPAKSEAKPTKTASSPATSGGQSGGPAPRQTNTAVTAADKANAAVPAKTVIPFKFNSNDIPRQSSASLDTISNVLINDPALKVNAIGYTDATGDYSYNKWLSLFRADVVKKYLIAKGVKPHQVRAIGMGPEKPSKTDNRRVDPRTRRRVEIVFVE
jgi:general secretion pathway protein A